MALIKRKCVSDGGKTWYSAVDRAGQFIGAAMCAYDTILVDAEIANTLIIGKQGSTEAPRFVLDLFLEREAAKGDQANDVVYSLFDEAIDLLREGALAGSTFDLLVDDTTIVKRTSADFAAHLCWAPDLTTQINRLREILSIDLGGTLPDGRPHNALALLRMQVRSKALNGDEDAIELLRDLRDPLYKLLASLSVRNTLVSFLHPEFANPEDTPDVEWIAA